MNNTEIVSLLERTAMIITHKTNMGAYNAIEHVLRAANNIIKKVDVSNDQHIPDVYLEQLKTSGITEEAIKGVRANRAMAANLLKEYIIWLYENYQLEFGTLWHEFIYMDSNETPRFLTPRHVAEYKAKNVLKLDSDMMFWRARIDAWYTAMGYTILNPRAAFEFISSLSYHPMTTLDITFDMHRKVMLAEARVLAKSTPGIDVDTIVASIKKRRFVQNQLLDPIYINLTTTVDFKRQLKDAMSGKEPIRILTKLELYAQQAFNEWITCEVKRYCYFQVLNNSFRHSLKHQDIPTLYNRLASLRKQSYEKLVSYVTNPYLQHPLQTIYNLTDNIISTYHEQNKTITISAVCQEITRVMLQHEQQRLNVSLNIFYALNNVSNSYVLLLCEKSRMECADELQSVLPVQTSLLLVSRTSLPLVRQLTQIFLGNTPASSLTSYRDYSYQQLTDIQLSHIMYTVNNFSLSLDVAFDFCMSYPDQIGQQGNSQLASYQQAKRAFSNCRPGLARQAFFNGSQLISKIPNQVLLTSVASLMTSCIQAKAQNSMRLSHSVEPATDNSSYDPLWLVGFCSLATAGVLCLGINLNNRFKPLATVKSALSKFWFWKTEIESDSTEKQSLLSPTITVRRPLTDKMYL